MTVSIRGRKPSPAACELARLSRGERVAPAHRSRSTPAVFDTTSRPASPEPSLCATDSTLGHSASERSSVASEAAEPTPLLNWADDVPESEAGCGGDVEMLPSAASDLPYPQNVMKELGMEFEDPGWTPPELKWFELPPGPCVCGVCNPMGAGWDLFFRQPPAHLTAQFYPPLTPLVVQKKKRRRGRRGRGGKGLKKREEGSDDASSCDEE